jgi:hypothetical protein
MLNDYCCHDWLGCMPVIAANRGHVDCLRRAHVERGHVVGSETLVAAASGSTGDSLACMRYAHEVAGAQWISGVTFHAASSGNEACLVYALDRGCPLHPCALTASMYGRDDGRTFLSLLLRWPEGQPHAADRTRACYVAALRGNLTCLVLAHESGCPWDADVAAVAAATGSLACLRYAHEHGCPWDDRTLLSAATFGRSHCIRYAVACGLRRRVPIPNMALGHVPRGILTLPWFCPLVDTPSYLGHVVLLPMRLRAAARRLEDAWLERSYRPGGSGARAASERFVHAVIKLVAA